MTLQEVITKAIEGGFSSQVAIEHVEDLKSHKTLTIHDYGWVFVREDFWMSLGKAMGWNQGDIGVCSSCGSRGEAENHVKCNCSEPLPEIIEEWLYQWHRFIDHLAEGKDAESFFESLTNHNT
jgi:hypothetical protein